MNVVRLILNFIIMTFKALVLAARIGLSVLAAWRRKSDSIGSFRRELENSDIPPEVAKELTRSYEDMVSLNVFSYTKLQHKK